MKTIVALLTTAVFVGIGSAALAQDNNNPAPSYGTMSPAGNPDTASKINDGNNPAPNYGSSTAAAPAPAKQSAAKYTTRSHAHHKKANGSSM